MSEHPTPVQDQTAAPAAVTLEFPADTRFLRTARLVTASAAADAGFDIDHVEDARIAADELCAALLEMQPSSAITFRFVIEPGRLSVEGWAEVPVPDGFTSPGNELRIALLGIIVDAHSMAVTSGRASVGFTKTGTDVA